MVKERPEEARNSLKGNFYFFLSLLLGGFGGLWRALALLYFLLFYSLFFIKISKLMYNNHSLSIRFKRAKGMKSTKIGFKIVVMVCTVVIAISAIMGFIINHKVESVLQHQATELLQKKLS